MRVDQKHDLAERTTHWLHVVNMALLLLSGFQMHIPDFNLFLTISNARLVHFISMYLFLALGVIHAYLFFALGKHKVALFGRGDVKDIIPLAKFYLFLSSKEPAYEKYNVLQKLSYAGLFAMSCLQAILGFALYWPESLAPVATVLGGLAAVRMYHYLVSWVFLSFTGVHLYLILTTDIRLLFEMVNGGKAREREVEVWQPAKMET